MNQNPAFSEDMSSRQRFNLLSNSIPKNKFFTNRLRIIAEFSYSSCEYKNIQATITAVNAPICFLMV
ncbi:hypothetical protein CS542_07080 [Pedobacter sp. IW39]|nr:hypothetical protein CS542_07080 [Pedobacter sp. IW39]